MHAESDEVPVSVILLLVMLYYLFNYGDCKLQDGRMMVAAYSCATNCNRDKDTCSIRAIS